MPTLPACRLDFLVDDEAKLISFMAGALQISEYEIFRIAHRNWFNHEITEKRLDSLFKDYLNTTHAPFWVNDFARKAHEKFKTGELNYKDYGIKRRHCDLRTKVTGWVIITCLLILLTVFSYYIAKISSY